MGEPNGTSGKAKIDTESVVKGMVGVSRVHQNVTQELVVVTEDKIRICLSNYVDRIGKKRSWIAPLGILVTIGIAFPTTDFKERFDIPASTWQAFFMFMGLASLIWFLSTLKAAFQPTKLADVISELKKETKETVELGGGNDISFLRDLRTQQAVDELFRLRMLEERLDRDARRRQYFTRHDPDSNECDRGT